MKECYPEGLGYPIYLVLRSKHKVWHVVGGQYILQEVELSPWVWPLLIAHLLIL